MNTQMQYCLLAFIQQHCKFFGQRVRSRYLPCWKSVRPQPLISRASPVKTMLWLSTTRDTQPSVCPGVSNTVRNCTGKQESKVKQDLHDSFLIVSYTETNSMNEASNPVLLTCFPKVILSFSDRKISAVAPLCLEMALFSPTSLVFINPVLVMWSAWQWVLTVTGREKNVIKTTPPTINLCSYKNKNSEGVCLCIVNLFSLQSRKFNCTV